ncbi:MAG: tRNA (guanine-n(1)-)-methyltransferase, tRNA (guanine37-N1)-methyltransferase [Candidatus Peregrinibacteria bacterium GW2011_GWC2_39_14]|nr:MAG: tRNA (guanine-N(1)-)-methyltransferase [Candidatus Peregrinibacteria bacterium GW2011_GWA2_38_36]KKR06831.1 MAG: tRNA (guanine-n(1)-)-methyltransferase, tRNA (guanine37-N1)-methyltransferase [Candidatus Peregrinibacteria bacterium GW2011_GWC2_39_14]
MRFDILTIFPKAFESYFNESMIKRAKAKKIIDIHVHDIRTFSKDKHKKVDHIPYGGGPGMVMTPQPIYDAIKYVKKFNKGPVLLMSPSGETFTHKKAQKLAKNKGLIFICGRYEGIDERVKKLCVDEEISIGEYVLTGGEMPAMVILDAVSRFIPEFLGKEKSLEEESFSESLEGKKEYPQYTRPPSFKGLKVPEVLQSGHHGKIKEWRKKHLS